MEKNHRNVARMLFSKSMFTRGKRTQHGKPLGVVKDDQPDAREVQAGRPGVAVRSVVPGKPGNTGGGKGPWFKINAGLRKGQEIGFRSIRLHSAAFDSE